MFARISILHRLMPNYRPAVTRTLSGIFIRRNKLLMKLTLELDQFIYSPHISSYSFCCLHWEKQVVDETLHWSLISSYVLLTSAHTLSVFFIGRNKLLIKHSAGAWSVHIFSTPFHSVSHYGVEEKIRADQCWEWWAYTFHLCDVSRAFHRSKRSISPSVADEGLALETKVTLQCLAYPKCFTRYTDADQH